MASAGTAEIQKLHKSSVRAVLLSQIGGVLLRNFTSDYKNLLNEPVPYTQYGFNNLESFLRALPDIVRFEYSNTNQDWRLFGIGDPSTFMSGHAKKAQGKPGQDKDPVDGANKRVRKGRGQRNRRIKLPQSPPHQATRQAPNRPPQQNGQCGYEDLTPDLRGFYALCCPIRQKHMKETILNELRTIAEVKDVRDSNGLLFTRYISKADAIKVLETFKAKYDMRIAKQRVSQAYPPPGRAKVNQTRSRNGEVGTSQASPFSVGGGTSSVSPFSSGWGTAGPFATGGVTSQTNPAIQDKTKGILDQYSGPGVEIYIGNIPKTLTQSHVLHLLSNITVKDLRIKGKENKWYAFGLIATPEEAALAVNRLNGHFFGGRRLICRLSKPDPAKTKPEANHAGPRNSSQDNFTPDPEALEALLFIEVPRDQAIAALKANNNNLQDASLWLVSNTEDLLTALKDMEATPKKTENRCAAFFPDPANLDELMVNGIEREHAIKALKVSNNNLEEAADWIMAHMAELHVGITTGQNNMESTQPINVPVETQPRNASEEVPPRKTPGEALPMKTPGKAPPINTPGEARPVEKEATFSPNPQHLEELLGYGIERETAIEALRVSKNDLDGAADWIIARTHLSGEEIQGENLTVNHAAVSTTLVVSANEVSRQEEQHTGLVTSTESVTASPIQPLGVGVSLEPQSSVDREVPKSLQMAPVPLPREEALVDLPPPLQEAVDDPSLPPLADDLPPPLEEDDDLPPPLEDDDDDSIPDLEHDDDDDDLTDRSTDSQSIITVGSASERVSIFVGRFPVDTKQIDLLELFSPYNPLKIKMINNFDPLRKTFAFVVLPSTELAEQAIEEMDRYQYRGKCLQVGRAFVKYGYTETPSDEEETEEPEAAPEDPLLAAVPESVSFHHILMTEVWPNAKILHTDLLGRLPVLVTAIVDEQFFFGQVLKFVQEQAALGLINEELDSVCKARPPEKRVPVHRCAAIYDGNWYRAYNMGELDNNKHAVMFLDYGNIERLDAKDLRRPELDMWNDPPIAKPFKLTKGSLSGYGVTEGIEVNVVASNDGTPCLASVTRVEMSRQSNY